MKQATALHNPTREGDGEGNWLFGMSVDRQQQAAQAAVVKLPSPRARCCLVTGVLMALELYAGHGEAPRSL